MTDSNMPDEQAELLDELADLLEEISSAEHRPAGFFKHYDHFESNEIEWTGNDWVNPVNQALQWMDLDYQPKVEMNKRQVQMFSFIAGHNDLKAHDCYAINGDTYEPSELGFELLKGSLETSLTLMYSYQKDIADGESSKKAKSQHQDRLEDLSSASVSTPKHVNATTDVWSIYNFADLAKRGKLELNPPYQRDVVWSVGEQSQLIDSVLRNIPLPSVIINKPVGRKNVLEIVDGKQRLTSILRFMGAHPKGLASAKALCEQHELDENLYLEKPSDWLKAVKTALGTKKLDSEMTKYWPFPFTGSKHQKARVNDPISKFYGKYYADIKDEDIGNKGDQVRDFFDGTEYKIAVIKYTDTPVTEIHSVFSIYNKSGKTLNAQELRNAKYNHTDICKALVYLSGINNETKFVDFMTQDALACAQQIRELFESCGLKDSRYAWAKHVGWMMAALASPLEVDETSGLAKVRSTAAFIDSMFPRHDVPHPLRDHAKIDQLCLSLGHGASIMNDLIDADIFPERFHTMKEGSSNWDMLPFYGMWLGCCLTFYSGEDISEPADRPIVKDAVRQVANREDMVPPDKQQTISQWKHITKVAMAILGALVPDRQLVVNNNVKSLFDKSIIDAANAGF